MKQLSRSLMMVGVLVASGLVSADESVPGEGKKGKKSAEARQQAGQRRMEQGLAMARRIPVMAALDADGDGVLSAAEIENASKALLTLDRDGDGGLSAEELRPEFAERAAAGLAELAGQGLRKGAMMGRMLEQRDANGDGKLSGAEIPERLRRMLERVDENGDGAIDKAELEKMASRMADRAGRKKPGDKDPNGGGGGVRPKRPAADNAEAADAGI